MTEYRIVADRDRGDDPSWRDVRVGDRLTTIRVNAFDSDLVRIERPVPTTAPSPSGIDHEYVPGRFGDDGLCHARVDDPGNRFPTRCYRARIAHVSPPPALPEES